jgi:hypothetical protein
MSRGDAAPTRAAHPYAGRRAVLATRHGKERALGLPLQRLGLTLELVPGLDTDALGTFSGEITRTGTPLETAIRKARLGMAASGSPLGIANEGSFGPHPANPLLPADHELAVVVDDERGMVVSETVLSHRTCHSRRQAPDVAALGDYLERIGFPRQAVVVQAAGTGPAHALFKAVADWTTLARAVTACAAASPEGEALVQPDLRAHLSPLRMRVIRQLGWRLSERLARLCPTCSAPGYGWLETRPGLPCGDCGEPTRMPVAEVHGCNACEHREQRPPRHGQLAADPAACDYCNP